jgi:creatinine amidohydrolase
MSGKERDQDRLALDELSSMDLESQLAKGPSIALLPLGSVEPHGPHLPLATDRLLSQVNADRAALALRERGVKAWVAPALPYGVTEYAQGFCGAISLSPMLYENLLIELSEQYLRAGFTLICWINHHLEPLQLRSIMSALKKINQQSRSTDKGEGSRVIAPAVVSRRWGRVLGEEFKSGACHAGAYESSMILASHPHLVNAEAASSLPTLEISLSEAIRSGKSGFKEIGMSEAYTGAPSEANAIEGERLYHEHINMVLTEVMESLEVLSEV